MISTKWLVVEMVLVIKGLRGIKELRVDGRGTLNAEGRMLCRPSTICTSIPRTRSR